MPKTKPQQTPVQAALAGLQPDALAEALEIEVDRVYRHHGVDAFEFNRRAVCEHEAYHLLVGFHERIPVRRAEIYRTPEPATSAIGVDGSRMGVVYAKVQHQVTAASDPSTDLRWVKYVVAGHVGGKLSPSRREGLGLDELVLGRALVCVVAAKLDTDPNHLFRDTCALTRRIIRANWSIAATIANKLEADGSAINNRWMRTLLDGVRRIEGGTPSRAA